MKHWASADFWARYRALAPEIRQTADRAFARFKIDPRHPSLHFKKVGSFWSARVGLRLRALAAETADGYVWFWIGTHAEYDKLVG